MPASFKVRLFKCFLDAAVSEQIARMVAMKAATENADAMIGNLSMAYNRARQGADHRRAAGDHRRSGSVEQVASLHQFEQSQDAKPHIRMPCQQSKQCPRNRYLPKAIGRVTQVIGSTFDVEFPEDQLPAIYNAVKVDGRAEGRPSST